MNDIGALLVMSFIFLVLFFCFTARRARWSQQSAPSREAVPLCPVSSV